MDIVSPPPAPPPLFVRKDQSSAGLKKVAIGATIIAVIISFVAYGLPYLHHGAASSDSIAVALGPVPASRLYIISKAEGSSVPYTVTFEGTELSVLDASTAKGGTKYYILAEPSKTGFISNVYAQPQGGALSKLTNSPTAKYNLTVRPNGGMLAYQAAAIADQSEFVTKRDWSITALDLQSGSERVVAQGSNPTFTGDSQKLLYANSTLTLFAAPLTPGHASSTAVMKLAGIPYAISPDGAKIAMVNFVTHNIDVYHFTYGSAPSYDSSITPEAAPDALGFVQGDLISARSTNATKDVVFTNFMTHGTYTIQFSASSTGQMPQRLYDYEK